MPTIEQVSKRLTSDPNWFNKCMLGVFLTIIPIVNFMVCGYLYRLFKQGKRHSELTLPEWGEDWKGLWVDGLKFFFIILIFAGIPIGVMTVFLWPLRDSFLAELAMAPVLFLAGPLASAALYLYLLTDNFNNCFNFQALAGLLKKAAPNYWVPTLAFLGLSLMFPVVSFFFGGVIYFYLMGYIFKNLELRADR